MPDGEVLDLMSRAGISFTGTVQRVGESRVAGVAADERTAVVRVDQVLHAPDALARLAGSDVTVQLAADAEILQPGQRAAFFADAVAFGETLAVSEVGRLPVEAVEPHVSAAMAANLSPQVDFRRQLAERRLQSHAARPTRSWSPGSCGSRRRAPAGSASTTRTGGGPPSTSPTSSAAS